jgi:hypothetical protein
MQLIARYDFRYGPRGRMDAEQEVIRRGDAFTPVATFHASAVEAGQHLIANGVAVMPEVWAKRKPQADAGWDWAKSEVAARNEGRRT